MTSTFNKTMTNKIWIHLKPIINPLHISEPEQIIYPFIKEDQRMEGIVSHLLSRLKTGCLDLGLEEASLGIHSFLLEKEIK